MLARIDVGNQDALARQDHDQALARETLQGFAELLKNIMILQGIDIAQYGFGATEEATG